MALSKPFCYVTAEQVGRVDLVVQQLTALPRRQVRGLFAHGCVRVNGEPCEQTHARVAEGDRIQVKFDPARRYHDKPRPRRSPFFSIVHEDEHLLVVDKAAGILTVPKDDAGEDNDSLMARVSLHLSKGMATNRAFACHRLDRNVSGLLAVGKTQAIAHRMRDQFELRKPTRVYYALLAGRLTPREGTIRSHLATAGNLDRYSTNHPDRDRGQLAITHYTVEQDLGDATLVRVQLETGRRNQIRVHFAEAGHPVLGDDRYAFRQAKHPRWRAKRLALHAAVLGFDHPVSGKALSFESPMPEPMRKFIADAGQRPPDAGGAEPVEPAADAPVVRPAAIRKGIVRSSRANPPKQRAARGGGRPGRGKPKPRASRSGRPKRGR